MYRYTAEEVLQLQVTKSGEAIMHRGRLLLGNAKAGKNGSGGGDSGGGGGGGGGNVKSHDRVKPRLLAPSDPFLVHVGVSTADGRGLLTPVHLFQPQVFLSYLLSLYCH